MYSRYCYCPMSKSELTVSSLSPPFSMNTACKNHKRTTETTVCKNHKGLLRQPSAIINRDG